MIGEHILTEALPRPLESTDWASSSLIYPDVATFKHTAHSQNQSNFLARLPKELRQQIYDEV